MKESNVIPAAGSYKGNVICSWGMRPLPVPDEPGKRTGGEIVPPVRNVNDPRWQSMGWREPDRKMN